MSVDTSPVERVLDRLDEVRPAGPRRWSARCPAHEDNDPSLSVKEGDDGRVLIYCHSGCSFRSIVSALGLRPSDLFAATANQGGWR